MSTVASAESSTQGNAGKQTRGQPEVDFDEGLQRTIDWFSNHVERYRADVYAV